MKARGSALERHHPRPEVFDGRHPSRREVRELGNPERAAEELARALKHGGEALFEGEAPRYLAFVKSPPRP